MRRFDWLAPTLLAALAATGIPPLAVLATLLLLCYLPGRYVVAGFGIGADWDRAGHSLLALPVSLAVMPVILNPIWHVTNDGRTLLLAAWLILTLGCLLSRWLVRRLSTEATRGEPDDRPPEASRTGLRLFDQKRAAVFVGLLAAYVAAIAIGTYWPTEPRGYPVPALIHDFIKHHAVLFSLEHGPLPLGNPFFADEATGPVYYYHFFYLIPATVRAIAPTVSIELAFGIQAALIGVAVAGMFYLIVKRFTGGDGPATLAAVLATIVGGFDIIPLVALRMRAITLDAWADTLVRIHNLFTQIVWTPQNVSGLLIILVGAYVLSEKGWWRGWFVLGPVLAASLIGSTVWVAAGVLPGLAVFVLLDLVSRRRRSAPVLKRLLAGGGVALLMLALALPSLLGYLEMSRRYGKGLTADWPHQAHALLGRFAPPGVLANVLDLPWMLALEFGPLLLFPLLLPRRIWRRAWDDDGLRLLLISAGVALVGFVTLRSHFTYNDFGQKIILAAQAAGVVLAACILAPESRKAGLLNPLGWRLHDQSAQRPRRALGWSVGIALLLGAPVGLFQSPLAAVRRHLSADGPLRALVRASTIRAAVEGGADRFMRRELPVDAVVQAHPGRERVDLLQIARRQIGVMSLERDTMVFYPVDIAAHDRALAEIRGVLVNAGPSRICHDTLRRHGVTHVFIGVVERERWRGLEKFADETCFERVYADAEAAVYALR